MVHQYLHGLLSQLEGRFSASIPNIHSILANYGDRSQSPRSSYRVREKGFPAAIMEPSNPLGYASSLAEASPNLVLEIRPGVNRQSRYVSSCSLSHSPL